MAKALREREREERIEKWKENILPYYDSVYEEDPTKFIQVARDDIRLFAFRYFQHYLKYPPSDFHHWLFDSFTTETGRKKGCKWAIAAPRGNSKSTLITLIFPLWCIAYKKKNFIIIISDTAGQAGDFLREIKSEIKGNKRLREDFPEIKGSTDVWRLDEIVTSNGVRVVALGSQNKILGRRHGASRPDLIIGDDLENQDNVISPLMRERMRDWFFKEVLKAGAIDGTTDFYVIGTVKHEDSLLANLLNPRKSPGWRSKKFVAVNSFSTNEELWERWSRIYSNRDDEHRFENAEKFYISNEDAMLDGVDILWPEGETYYQLMEVKQEGDVSFASEKMNLPIDRSKCLIDPYEIRYYEWNEIVERDLVIYGALDPATGKGRATDYSCIVTVGKCRKSGKVFILDSWFSKLSIEKQIKMIMQKHERFHYQRFFIEENAFQVVIKDHVQKLSRLTQAHVPVQGVKHGGNQKKELRIEWMIPFLKDGTVFFHRSQKLLIEQVCNFTPDGRNLYDDGPDCLSIVLREVLKKRFRMIMR